MYPFSDDFMQFDEDSGHYVLTEYALIYNGTNIRERLQRNRNTNATAVITRLLRRVSDIIYNYIHTFSTNNLNQDNLIATLPSLRPIIMRAMLEQAEYFLLVGDLTRSVEKDKREVAIDYSAKETLNTVVDEIGVPITYMGGYYT